MKSSTILTISAAIFAAFLSTASAASLSTIYTGGNGNDGVMFDVVADQPVTIESFNTNTGVGSGTFEIYTKVDTFVGSEGTSAAWTLVGTQSIVNPAANVPSPTLVLSTPVSLPGGTRQGFYIRSTDLGVNYTNGDGVGTLEAQDLNLRIFEGTGISGTFGGANVNRIPNITANYSYPANALSTSFLGGNSAVGIMFDVIANQPLSIASLQFAFNSAATADVEVYTKTGTFVGSESTAAAWTLLGTSSFTSPAANAASANPFAFSTPVSVAAGARQAFYIRSAGAPAIAFTNGVGVGPGAVNKQDSALQILQGSSISGTFGGVIGTPRIPNVTIRYAFPAAATPAAGAGTPSLAIVGSKKLRTTASSVQIFGVATGGVKVSAVFQVKKRKVTRPVAVAANGLFSFKLKTVPGRNLVTFVGTGGVAPATVNVTRVP